MDALKEWWGQASVRDQLSLLVGGGFVVLYILFMMVLKPVTEMRDKEEMKNRALVSNLEEVRILAAQVIAKSQGGSKKTSSRSLESIVQTSVATHSLQVASMNASGDNGVRLRFEEANFENVLKWLHEMEVSQSLRIKDISITPASNPGAVTVNMRLHQE